ncbi:MAG: heat-inducible transcription repressor HrcA [Clostridiales bacterium]|nr:heat-inducible transcription repressor HrcA [Clostridiales bacterium]
MKDNKGLSERRKKILNALVDSYISDAEPISSAAIKDKYMPDVSTATIRSELATLEEMGYLSQPHISAGRVPSSKAYKFYVDNILANESQMDLQQVKSVLATKYASIKEIVKDSAKIVSDVTNYTSLLMISSTDNILVNDVKVIDMYDGTALVLIVTNNGSIKDKTIKLPDTNISNYIEVANGLLYRTFAGKRLVEIVHSHNVIDSQLRDFEQLFEQVLNMIIDYKNARESQIQIEGKDKIFNYPEYNDVNNVKNFLSIVNDQEKLHEIVNDKDGSIEFSIKIGKEDDETLNDMAIVSAKYKFSGEEVGQLGVIGPQRMDYKKVLSVLREIGTLFENN